MITSTMPGEVRTSLQSGPCVFHCGMGCSYWLRLQRRNVDSILPGLRISMGMSMPTVQLHVLPARGLYKVPHGKPVCMYFALEMIMTGQVLFDPVVHYWLVMSILARINRLAVAVIQYYPL